jgi:hypothetical protein
MMVLTLWGSQSPRDIVWPSKTYLIPGDTQRV